MSAEQATGVSCADPGEAAASFRCARTCALCVPDVGPIRRVVEAGPDAPRRYLVILPGSASQRGKPVEVEVAAEQARPSAPAAPDRMDCHDTRGRLI
jgi:hypothetical protein